MADVKETLLSVSAVYLFGRLISDLQLVKQDDTQDGQRPDRRGANRFLEEQVRNKTAGFARIFFFSFEGSLFELARPTIFLVHGGGDAPDTASPNDANFEQLLRTPGPVTRTGVGWQYGSFARDIRVWVYDKSDVSMRLDADTGSLEQILLSAESASVAPGLSSSVLARPSGAFARSSNAMARSSNVMRRSGDID
jgi:hypothetical protein